MTRDTLIGNAAVLTMDRQGDLAAPSRRRPRSPPARRCLRASGEKITRALGLPVAA